jgi:hypothetical protein
MDRLTIQKNGFEISFAINRIKILYGSNSDHIYECMRAIESYSSRELVSEYGEERGGRISLSRNDHLLQRQDILCVRLDPYYNFEQDSKLGVQSLMHQYCMTLLEDIVYDDAFSTLVAAYSITEEEAVNTRLCLKTGDINVRFNLEPLAVRLLEKHLKPNIFRDDYKANGLDVSTRDLIMLQVAMICRIAKKTTKTVFVIADFRGVYDYFSWLYEIGQGEGNVYVIAATDKPHEPGNLLDYVLVENQIFDLANADHVYALALNLPFYVESGNMKQLLRGYIQGKASEREKSLQSILRMDVL